MTDEEIKKDVVDQLFWDNRIDASKIQVAVAGGHVTLTGEASSFTSFLAAEEDSYSVPEVKTVENRIVVKYPPAKEVPTDEDLRKRIESMLNWNSEIEDSDINVFVVEGFVTLEGSVDSYWKKARAEDLVAPLRGVVSVTNKLAVVPTESISDKIIADDIVASLDRNIMINIDDIDVEVDQGNVTISGRVPSHPAFKAAQEIATRTAGVKNVSDNLLIGGGV